MLKTFTLATSVLLLLSSASFAQEDVVAGAPSEEVDCDDPNNAEEDECLGLPIGGQDITNFVPLVAPLLVVAAVAVALAGGGTTSTVSTTGATN
jgi:hypothetical protein